MNEKLNTQHIIDAFAEKQHISKKSAEGFVKEFFGLVQDALKQERYVKIKGLGTFKVIEVEERTSVDVNTGQRISIGGHSKITFTPDGSVKDLINKPFENFEIVMLNDESILGDTPATEEAGPAEEAGLTEEATETLHIVEEACSEDKPVAVEEEAEPVTVPLMNEAEPEPVTTRQQKYVYVFLACLLLAALMALLILVL